MPNIVFIVADDLGYADVGYMGGKEIQTPHLDKLAAGGTILESFYVQPVCSPTRATLMTGRYPTRTGVYTVVRPHAHWGLPLNERTLSQALHEAGYTTAICGKWHLGEFQTQYQPTHRGFDRQYGHFFGALDYFTHVRDGQRDWYRDDQPCADEGYTTHLIAREACRLIHEQEPQKSLFLYVPFNAVHSPHQVPDKYLQPYGQLTGVRKTYAGMVAAMDEAIGQIISAVEEKGIREQTLIVFCSDNGGPSPGVVTDNRPLRAGKATIFEGGVRVCACVNWPGHVPARATVKEPLHMVDWFPTLVRLAGGKLAGGLPLDGRDAWQTITAGAPSPHEALLLCAAPNRAAVRAGDWKLLINASAVVGEGEVAAPASKKGKKKAATGASLSNAPVQLYNLADDIGETKNLAAAHPEKVKELQAKLDALLTDAVPPGDQTE